MAKERELVNKRQAFLIDTQFVFLEEQFVSDIVNYIDHGDPQIRGATAILCGTIVYSILSQSRFDVDNWQASIRTSTGNRGMNL